MVVAGTVAAVVVVAAATGVEMVAAVVAVAAAEAAVTAIATSRHARSPWASFCPDTRQRLVQGRSRLGRGLFDHGNLWPGC